MRGSLAIGILDLPTKLEDTQRDRKAFVRAPFNSLDPYQTGVALGIVQEAVPVKHRIEFNGGDRSP
jgi:hypothetical protein